MIMAQKQCIGLNRDIVFIWVQDKSILESQKFRQLVQEQVDAGVDVWIAEKENVSSELHEDYGIVDNRYFYISTFSSGKPDQDNVSNEPDKLRSYEEKFRRLYTRSENSEEYYAHKS
jgi:hypothetical protein